VVEAVNNPMQNMTAGAISLGFSAVAFFLRGVTLGGAAAGAVICFLLCVGGGYSALAPLVTVFVLTWASTKAGYRRKSTLGTAERSGGRNALQVLANLGVPAVCAVVFLFTSKTALLLAMVASLSEAAADTVSSEAGQLSKAKPRLITTGQEVPAGTDGGITIFGTLAGLTAATIVTGVCVASNMLARKGAVIAIVAALSGTLADSFLGASLERRKFMSNDAVNLIGTAVAASMASTLW